MKKQKYKELEGDIIKFKILIIKLKMLFGLAVFVSIIFAISNIYIDDKRDNLQEQNAELKEQIDNFSYGFSSDGMIWIHDFGEWSGYVFSNGSWYKDGVEWGKVKPLRDEYEIWDISFNKCQMVYLYNEGLGKTNWNDYKEWSKENCEVEN